MRKEEENGTVSLFLNGELDLKPLLLLMHVLGCEVMTNISFNSPKQSCVLTHLKANCKSVEPSPHEQ